MAAAVLAAGLVLAASGSARADAILVGSSDWMGSRDSGEGGGILATDGWADGALALSWTIAPVAAGDTVSHGGSVLPNPFGAAAWFYAYEFSGASPPEPAISHLLLEVSPTITENNVRELIQGHNFVLDGTDKLEGPTLWTADPLAPDNTSPGGNGGSPNLPADLYGIKADIGSDEIDPVATYFFFTLRAPIWGDFYVKDGRHGGVVAVAFNEGIGTDPTSSTTDFTPWIPVPDTTNGQAPVPSTLLLLGLGLLGLRRRRG